MKKQIGIWIDYKEANLITLSANGTTLEKIESEIEDFHLKGGARSKTPYGPMDVSSEKKHLERRKNQIKKYYHRIMTLVKDAQEIYIMGAAEAKVGLKNKMIKDKNFHPIIKGFETVDSITDNQKIAKVWNFFAQKV